MNQLWLALRADPVKMRAAMWARLRRYRVRGRRLLAEAAAQHPKYYAWWVRTHGPRSIARWCDTHPPSAERLPGLAVLILGEDRLDNPACENDVVGVVLRPTAGQTRTELVAALDHASGAGAEWLVAIHAGDRIGRDLMRVLSGAPLAPDDPMVFWDCDFVAADGSVHPVIKPAWDPVLAARCDLLARASAVRIDVVKTLLAAGQDADKASWAEMIQDVQSRLALRREPYHIPLILTHLADRPARPNGAGASCRSTASPALPGVSVLVPTRDSADLLETCIGCIDRVNYPGPVELIVIDNDSVEDRTFALFEALRGRPNCRVLAWPGPFNFAAMMNGAATLASQPFLCLLNNDVHALDDAWLAAMMAHAIQPECGAVGARLLYPEGVVQHAGVAIGIGGAAGHVAKGAAPDDQQFELWHGMTRRVSAVTAACLVVEAAKFQAVGGMDPEAFAIDFNDVDLCLKLDAAGWRNIVVMEATLVHLESMSRGTVRHGADRARFDAELAELKRRWRTEDYVDPWYSPLFSQESERCVLRT